MAATSEVINMKLKNLNQNIPSSEFSSTSYFACLHEMMQNVISNYSSKKVF
jgi:hypothetical protein